MARFKNLGDLIRRDRDLTKVAIIDLGGEEVPTEYTYLELDAMTVGVARALAKQGFKRGTRIAILSANRAEFIAGRFEHRHYFCLARNVRLLRESVTTVLLDFLHNGLGFLRPGDKVNTDIGAGSAKSDGDSLANS